MDHLERYSEKEIEERFQAMNYLFENFVYFPDFVDGFKYSDKFFKSFRFVNSNGNIYFANGITSGISKNEFYDYQMGLQYVNSQVNQGVLFWD